MLSLSASQFRKALAYLSLLHIAIIAASNYLVQFPFDFFGLHNTYGALTFPFVFLATDLTVRIFGKVLARRIIFAVMFPALLLSYVISVVFADGKFSGLAGLGEFNLFVARIALASFMAYLLGQLLDIQVFERLRQASAWWVAPAVSTVFGNAVDTLVFFSVAFHNSPDAFMAAHWPQIALLDYGFKLALSLLFFLPAYGLFLAWLQLRLLKVAPDKAAQL